jgi:putative transposase
LGLVIGVSVTEANLSERLGGAMLLSDVVDELSQTEVIWVDSGYRGANFARVVGQICGARVEVMERIAASFAVLPKRWIVERTFGWFNRFRRLSKDYELHVEHSEAMLYGAMIRLLARRLAA